MTVIHTARAGLRPFTQGDAERLYDIRSRPDVARWLGDPTPWPDLAFTHDKIDRWRGDVDLGPGCGAWAIDPHDGATFVGTVNVKPLDGRDGEHEMGWCLHPDAVGHGWAREAAAAALDHALAAGIPRVWAIMWAHNEPSVRVATAIGLHDQGVRLDPWYGTTDDPWSRMFCTDPGAADELGLAVFA